jgi:hypothetical protein
MTTARLAPLKHQIEKGPHCGAVLYREGVILVAADHGPGMPPDPRHPCWNVVCGHDRVDAKKWLTSLEVENLGGFTLVGNLHDLISPVVPLRRAG